MSHMTRIKTKFIEKRYLIQALTDLGYPSESGESPTAPITVTGGVPQKITFRHKKNGYIAEAYEGGRRVKDLVDAVTQRYAYVATLDQLQSMGFELAQEEVGDGQAIHLTLRRIA